MTDAWNGVPQNPERDGWHWVQHRENTPEVLYWSPLHGWNYEGDWVRSDFIGLNYRYLGPCLTPAEVQAREAAAYRKGQEDMRERAAQVAEGYPASQHGYLAANAEDAACDAAKEIVAVIRALPIKDAPHD